MTLLTRDPATGLRRGNIRFPDGQPPTPNGCRWCGGSQLYPAHGIQYLPGVGAHQWVRPTDAQRLARMRARRAARGVRRG